MSAEELKQLGNKAFSAGDHQTAIKHFTDAIALDPNNHVLYSNRSASYASLKNYVLALEDAEKCVSIKPDWSKGYSRKGAALHGLNKLRDAEATYRKGLEIDPNNEQLKKALAEIREAGGQGLNMISNLLQDPNLLGKLAANPKTKHFLTQPDFIEKIKAIQANPQSFELFANDQRILQAVLSLIGFDANAEDPMEAATRPPEQEAPKEEAPKKEAPKSEPKPEPKKEEAPKPEPKKEAKVEEEPMNVDDSTPKVSEEQKKRANEEKELGTQLYKKRDFDGALKHYKKAWEIDSTNIVFLNNIAAVHFEAGDFDRCIEASQQAVEVGRDLRADFQHIAKAFARIAGAYSKKEDYENAVLYYGKSLSEHRNPEVLTKLREAEKLRDQKAKEAYINPQLSDEAREKGNQFFKDQNYGEAVKWYTEATKRNPRDAKNYSNRAAAYTKLLALPEALKDCEEAIKLDPKFLKAHIRKATTLVTMKKFSEAQSSIDAARELDTENSHANELRDLELKCLGGSRNMSEAEVTENARRDPEVLEILSDPVMNTILEQMKTDPRAAGEHLKNPIVAKKIQKLVDAGIIRMGR